MTEDFLTRAWADGHQHFSDQIAEGIGDAVEAARVGLARLNRYEFDAPWRRTQARDRRPRQTRAA